MDDIYEDVLAIQPIYDINVSRSDHGNNYVYIQAYFLDSSPDANYQLYYKEFDNSDHMIRYGQTQPQTTQDFHFKVTVGHDYEFFIVAVNDQQVILSRTFINKFQSSSLLLMQNYESIAETSTTNRKRQNNGLALQLNLAHQSYPLINLYTRVFIRWESTKTVNKGKFYC